MQCGLVLNIVMFKCTNDLVMVSFLAANFQTSKSKILSDIVAKFLNFRIKCEKQCSERYSCSVQHSVKTII